MKRIWTETELKTLRLAHSKRVCGLNPAWGRCSHHRCRVLWSLTPETATMEERRVIFGEMLHG